MGLAVAALQRFYGGDPERWLDMPLYLVRSLSSNMEAVAARETLSAAQAAALGSGAMRREDAGRLLADLQARAGAGGGGRKAAKASPAALEAMGIGVARAGR